MKATETLKHEHEAVKLMLRIVAAACSNLKSGEKPPAADFDEMMDFLKGFVDKCHHGKEEQILFPSMEAVGVPRYGSPIEIMLAEHEQGRGYIRNMSGALDGYRSGSAEAEKALGENAAAYIELLESHIQKENNVLFFMADEVLSAEQQDKLFSAFEELEEKVIGLGRHEEFHRSLERLNAKFRPHSRHEHS